MGKGVVFSSTGLPRKDMYICLYKHTSTSPGDRVYSQVDHVIVEIIHKSTITNLRSYRGADEDTDHYLVIKDIKIKLF